MKIADRMASWLAVGWLSASGLLAESPSEPPDPATTDLPAKIMALEATIAKERKEDNPASQGSGPAANSPPSTSGPPTEPQAVKKQNAVMHAFAALKINTARGDYTDAIISAEALALVSKSTDAKAELNDLIADLSKLRATQEMLAAADVSAVLTRASSAVVAATNAKDLDPVLVDIGAAMDRNRIGTFTSTHLALTAQLADADRFIKDWQNYLFDRAAGDRQSCAVDLERLAGLGETFRPIPRSQLLELYRSTTGRSL